MSSADHSSTESPLNRLLQRIERLWPLLLVGILLLGGVLRTVHLVQARKLPLYQKHRLDSLYYHNAARYIVDKDVGLGKGPLHMSPLYTYALAGVYALFGEGPDGIRVLQSLLGLAVCGMVFFLGTSLANRAVGLLACLLCALYGPLIFYESVITPATLAAFMMTASLSAFILARKNGRGWAVLLFGVLLGLSVITRPNVLLFLPIALAGVLLDKRFGEAKRRRWLHCALVVLGVVASVAPITIRNQLRGDSFVLVTDAAGINFYIGNRQGASGYFEPVFGAGNALAEFRVFRRLARKRSGRKLTWAETSRFWVGETFREIGKDPVSWLGLLGRKLLFLFNQYEIPNTRNYQFSTELTPVLQLPLVEFGWLMPFMLLGFFLFALKWRESYPLIGMVACYSGALVLFFVLAHYRLPMLPLCLILAAYGVWKLLDWILTGQRKRYSVTVVLLILGFLFSFYPHPKLDRQHDQDWFQLGYAYHVLKRPDDARRSYEQALKINPRNTSARKNLGRLYQSQHKYDAAIEQFLVILQVARERKDLALERYARRNIQGLMRLKQRFDRQK